MKSARNSYIIFHKIIIWWLYMKYFSSLIMSLFVLILFSACSSKDVKQLGGNMIAAPSGSGSPLGLVFIGAGGIVYGVGALSETQEEKEAEEKRKSAKPLFPEEPFGENNPVIIDTLKVQVSDVKQEVADSNVTQSENNSSL